MENKRKPTGLMLVGATFICMSILIGAASGAEHASLPDLQGKLKETTSLRLILSEQLKGSDIAPKTPPTKQSIPLSSDDPSAQISDLTAINSVAERDVVFDEQQNGDPNARGLANSLGVSVIGDQAEMEESWSEEEIDWDSIATEDVERIVDDAINSSPVGSKELLGISAYKSLSAQEAPRQLGNNLKIDVKGVSVTALNTAEGGRAEATSNIIIKPVQMIICPSEVGEKLK
ncbi:MAG TPA: hypothetical protein PLK88_04220 [Methanothrix sp.]|nr:hypothetical protein [Methanothrix sp.]